MTRLARAVWALPPCAECGREFYDPETFEGGVTIIPDVDGPLHNVCAMRREYLSWPYEKRAAYMARFGRWLLPEGQES